MNELSLMQKVLGDQWAQLPAVLQKHYQHSDNTEVGVLDIEYPVFMQPYLSFLRLMGALINRRGKKIPTTVSKRMVGDIQYWHRSISFPNGRVVLFKSRWMYAGDNELIEYINPFIGLRMRLHVNDDCLYYQGLHYVVKLGRILLPIPEWLVLGHTMIEEKALDDKRFSMDFSLQHPWFGQLFSYAGVFRVDGAKGHVRIRE